MSGEVCRGREKEAPERFIWILDRAKVPIHIWLEGLTRP